MQNKKLATPRNCMFLISRSLYLILFIWPCITCFLSSSLYLLCRLRTRLASDKNRLVYASMIRLIAGNKSAGVLIVISMIQTYIKSFLQQLKIERHHPYDSLCCPIKLLWYKSATQGVQHTIKVLSTIIAVI